MFDILIYVIAVIVIAISIVLLVRRNNMKNDEVLKDQHKALHTVLLEFNDLMKLQSESLRTGLESWCDLNEEILRYVTTYYNKEDLSHEVKKIAVVEFMKELSSQLDSVIKSKNQEEQIVELVSQFKTNKPMYGISP